MYLKNLLCSQFKSHLNKKLDFTPGINIISGKNGVGKTNILDAIHYLSAAKSTFASNINTHITHNEKYFIIEGNFIKYDISGSFTKSQEIDKDGFEEDECMYNVKCSYSADTRKIIQVNNVKCKTVKEHIGRFPVIFFSPNDIDALKWGSEYRRKIFDIITCQVDAKYMNELIEYNKFLKYKNILLKNYKESGRIDYALVDYYDENLQSLGRVIYEKRKRFIYEFGPLFVQKYAKVVGHSNEAPSIRYESHFADPHFNIKSSINKDLALGYSTAGIHKDDYDFLLNGYPLRYEGSEGQKRTFFVALRLAQRNFIYNQIAISPILLMDDVFGNLDQDRVSNVMNIISQQNFGQIFITCAMYNTIFDRHSLNNVEVCYLELV